jgi:hypothetical protein
MITRIWHGWTERQNADAYQHLLTQEISPWIRARGIPGVGAPTVLRRDNGQDEVEFVTIMTFPDWGAVEAFAGPDNESAVVLPAAHRLLKRFDHRSQHYDVIPGLDGWGFEPRSGPTD